MGDSGGGRGQGGSGRPQPPPHPFATAEGVEILPASRKCYGRWRRALDAATPHLRDLSTCPTVPAAVASVFGVLPAETMLLRLATGFRTAADDEVRFRIVSLPPMSAAEPDRILRRVATLYGTAGSMRARALALRMFGCLAYLAKDSVHVRSLILSGLCSSNAAEPSASNHHEHLVAFVGCQRTSHATLQVLARLITSPTSEAQVILAAIKAFSKLDCTLAVIHRVHEVGKQVLGNLENVFKANVLTTLHTGVQVNYFVW